MVTAAQKPKLDPKILEESLQVRNLERLTENKVLFALLKRAVQAFLDERDGAMQGVLMELLDVLRKLKPEYCEFLETFTERVEPDIDGLEHTTYFPPVEDGALEWIASRAETLAQASIPGNSRRQKLSLLARTEEACVYLKSHNTTEEAQQRLMSRLIRIYKSAYGPFDVPKRNAASSELHPVESLYEAVQDALVGNIRTPGIVKARKKGLFVKAHTSEKRLAIFKNARLALKLRALEETPELLALHGAVAQIVDGELKTCTRRKVGRPAKK